MDKLKKLVSDGIIKSFNHCNVSEDGVIGEESNCRNTERLTITFNDDNVLVIDTFCSGCAENTYLYIS